MASKAVKPEATDDWMSAPPKLTAEEEQALRAFDEAEAIESKDMPLSAKQQALAALAAEVESGTGGIPQPGSRPARPPGVWTLDDLETNSYAEADLYGDGRFLFTFNPEVMGRTDVQKQFRKIERMSLRTGKEVFELASGYATILYQCLKGGTWPLQEEMEDPETGEPLIDPETGHVQTRPLPITLLACERLRTDTVVKFFVAMQRSLTGEASGQPSPTA